MWCCGRFCGRSCGCGRQQGLFTLICKQFVVCGRPTVRAGAHAETEDWPSEIVDIYSLPPFPASVQSYPFPSLPSTSSRPFHPATPTPPLLSWPLKLLINACVFYFFGFFRQIHKVAASAIQGVYYHAEGATPFRLGCTRRERHFNLCAYPFPLCILIAHTFLVQGILSSYEALTWGVARVADTRPPLTAWPTRLFLCRRRVPRGTHVPVRIPLQATRYQGSSRCIGIGDPRS